MRDDARAARATTAARSSLLHEVRAAKKEEDADVLFNIATCERELKHFENAERYFKIYTDKFASHSHGWASLAECQFQLKAFNDGMRLSRPGDQARSFFARRLDGARQLPTGARANSTNALASYRRANQIQPNVECWLNAGLTLLDIDRVSEAIDCLRPRHRARAERRQPASHPGQRVPQRGRLPEAVADYQAALTLAPGDGETLKKACLCLLAMRQGDQAIELCQGILRVQPDMLTATLVHEWVLNELVPIWHVPMMNEQERNKAYFRALESVVTPDKVVFEIGTGSGLLAMMAARLGATNGGDLRSRRTDRRRRRRRIVKRNNYQDRVTVLPKLSSAVQLGKDLPVQGGHPGSRDLRQRPARRASPRRDRGRQATPAEAGCTRPACGGKHHDRARRRRRAGKASAGRGIVRIRPARLQCHQRQAAPALSGTIWRRPC